MQECRTVTGLGIATGIVSIKPEGIVALKCMRSKRPMSSKEGFLDNVGQGTGPGGWSRLAEPFSRLTVNDSDVPIAPGSLATKSIVALKVGIVAVMLILISSPA